MRDPCSVAVAQDSTVDQYQPESAAESHLLLLKQKKHCNVTFTFPNLPDRIEAHEFCLKARSPVFVEIFRERKSRNVQGNEIQIRESSPEIFQQFLEFIYADKLEVDIAGALNLLQLAQKYMVQPLTKKCEDILLTKIPLLDSVKVFEAVRRYGRGELMDRAGQIMVKSFLELVSTGALANAEEETLAYLLKCDDLSVNEVELFEIILKWGKNQVGTSADDELLRNKLKNLISAIRYTNMPPDEFTMVVVPTGLLPAEDTISVFSYLCGNEITRRDLKMKFRTTPRKEKATEILGTHHEYKQRTHHQQLSAPPVPNADEGPRCGGFQDDRRTGSGGNGPRDQCAGHGDGDRGCRDDRSDRNYDVSGRRWRGRRPNIIYFENFSFDCDWTMTYKMTQDPFYW